MITIKTILLLHTGGTISMKVQENGSVSPNALNPITDAKSTLASYANISELEAFNLPSPHITPIEMLKLRDKIEEQSALYHLDSVVITHDATDTLEETAYFLDVTTQLNFPIVLQELCALQMN